MEIVGRFLTNFLAFINPFKRDQPHPTLRFHTTHGTNINLRENRTTVTRFQSYDNGLVFSDRPIEINEIVPVKVSEVRRYKGPLFFGFTSIDPSSLSSNEVHVLRSHEYRECGVWLKGLHQYDMQPDLVLQFKVMQNGFVRYSVNATIYETPLARLQTNVPLWAVFDVYGSVGGIKLIDVPLSSELSWDSPSNNSNERSQPPSIFIFPPVPDSPMSISHNQNASTTRSPRARFAIPDQSPTSPLNLSFSEQSGFHTPTTPSGSLSSECIICVTNEATTAFIRCGHLCVCQECASQFIDLAAHGYRRKTHSCPMCRAPIVDLLRVYVG